MPRALLSVYDKTGLIELAKALYDMGWELVASGKTEQALKEAGLPATALNQVTGLPEMLGGRVKTLHPAIHAGILARDRADDMDELNRHGYAPINLVVSNLYPFQETIAKPGIALQDAIEEIDIGGVTLLRASAKNFLRVAPLCDPADYGRVIESLRNTGEIELALRRQLAVKAFAHTRDYDTAIHAYLAGDTIPDPSVSDPSTLPEHLALNVHAVEPLRYGENPHQIASYYSRHKQTAPLGGKQFGGKQLSYNNILDLDAAWRAVSSYSDPTVVIVKHLNPCGIARGSSLTAAYPRALESDPVSAFGGVIAVNRTVDESFVAALGALFVEAIAAPEFSPSALSTLLEKRQNCRLLQLNQPFDGSGLDIRSVMNGLLIQRYDMGDPEGTSFKAVTERPPTPDELEAMRFAWTTVQHVKSNAIVLTHRDYTVGIGGGLSSRVDSVELAVKKAGDRARGSVLASDAFFPFPDGIEAAARAGVTAVIQPGGSIRDAQVIEAANKAGLAMIFTGARHFRH